LTPVPVEPAGEGGHRSPKCIERSTLTLKVASRRFTRLTNGFSRKVENLEQAVALHHMHYNCVWKHTTLGTMPAVAAGIETCEWSMADLVAMLEATERGDERRLLETESLPLKWRLGGY
jgi:hypothetical protein